MCECKRVRGKGEGRRKKDMRKNVFHSVYRIFPEPSWNSQLNDSL